MNYVHVYMPETMENSFGKYARLEYVEYASTDDSRYSGLDIDEEHYFADEETGLMVKDVFSFEKWMKRL